MLVGNQSPLPLIDLLSGGSRFFSGWESVTSPFDRLNGLRVLVINVLGISHLSL